MILRFVRSLLMLGLALAFAVMADEYYDCCSRSLSSIEPFGCEETTTVGNKTYYCADVETYCDSCHLTKNLSSSSCYRCCITVDEDICDSSSSYITSSSWSKHLYRLNLRY